MFISNVKEENRLVTSSFRSRVQREIPAVRVCECEWGFILEQRADMKKQTD